MVVSNKATNLEMQLTLSQTTNELASSNEVGDVSHIPCAKCGADDVSEWVPRRFDKLMARFFVKDPSGPYRCLSCHHRFWLGNAYGKNPLWRWAVVFFAVAFILFLMSFFGVFDRLESSPSVSVSDPEVNQPDSIDQVHSGGDSVPTLASLIDAPQSAGAPENQTNIRAGSKRPQAFVSYEEPLTPEQKARRLLYAKQESEQAERLSQARVKQLEKVLAPAEEELESLVKIELGYVVERWREAWSKGSIDDYLVNYSAGFTPANNLSIDAWKANRRSRVTPEKEISVELSNFEISMVDELNSAVIEFNQRYESGAYVENSRKRLSLVIEQGSWKITSEVELN